jgi:alanine-glyoxylate transaminase/serine-glyoxylate transaminase/serine-pyruvate transaminase
LLLVDTVTSLGAVPLFLDQWGIDLAYSCSQKGLGCPPGIAPFTMSPRAVEKMQNRRTIIPNWYLDMSLLSHYWGSDANGTQSARTYHHTAPINMNYALREALYILAAEGIENSWQRHQENAELLWEGLETLGLSCHVEKAFRLPTLTTVKVPDSIDAKAIATKLRTEYNLEIGLGLGELAGKVWRIGLMGYNSHPEKVLLLLGVLQKVLKP